MAVEVSIIGKWLVPILIACAVTAIVTYIVCIYFGKRFGGSNDFERTLGLWGTATGTIPSGMALVRIVDPNFDTPTAAELGIMNFPMMFSSYTMLAILAYLEGGMTLNFVSLSQLIPVVICLVLLRVMKLWGKPTFTFGKNKKQEQAGIQK